MNNEIKQDMIKEKIYFTDESDEKIFIDMWCSKGYTGELKELSRYDADIDLTISLTKAAGKKNEAQGLSVFASWILVCNHK